MNADNIAFAVWFSGMPVSCVIGASMYQYEKQTSNKVIVWGDWCWGTFWCSVFWPVIIVLSAVGSVGSGLVYLFGLPGTIIARRCLKARARQEILNKPIQEVIAEAEQKEME